MAESIAKDKSYTFALGVVNLCTELNEQKQFEVASQLLRCGTSIGANVEEALAAYSRREFAAKMSIASKEAREANYWLRLLIDAKIVVGGQGAELLGQSEELTRILTSIVKTVFENPDNAGKLKTKN